jgi:hypothetical protein
MSRAGLAGVCLILLSAGGCGYAYVAPAPLPERTPVSVPTSVGRSWDLVMDALAQSNLLVATSDKGTGLIISQSLVVTRPQSTEWSDCGRVKGSAQARDRGFATRGEIRVLVAPAGQVSTIHVTAVWSKADMYSDRAICASTGVYERALEGRIVAAASHQAP